MIVDTADLGRFSGSVTMADGGFDPLHAGHVAYLTAAAELGLPLLCNVSSDRWVGRKHAPLLPQDERGVVIDALRCVAYTHLSSVSTADVLRLLRPRVYAKGLDWQGRLPAEEIDICAELGIEIAFLDTVTNSSTSLLKRYEEATRARV